MSKLIRDKVQGHLESAGTYIKYTKAEPHERTGLLFAKLLEEAGEWLNAVDREEKLKELGDLQEVIWAIGKVDNIEPTEILQQAHGKQKARGGFDELIVMTVELESDKKLKPATTQKQYDMTPGSGLGDGPWYSG